MRWARASATYLVCSSCFRSLPVFEVNEHHEGPWAANYRINPLSGRIIENPLNGYYRVGLVDTPLPELVTMIGPNVRALHS